MELRESRSLSCVQGRGFGCQLEADSPPSPLFSSISSPQIVSRGSYDSYAVDAQSLPIQVALLLYKRHCQHLPARPWENTELCHRACPDYLPPAGIECIH